MIYPSIDKILTMIDSKYKLVHIVATRSKEMKKTGHYQMEEKNYQCSKNIGRAMEEVLENLIHVE